jgi:hypothetical protein
MSNVVHFIRGEGAVGVQLEVGWYRVSIFNPSSWTDHLAFGMNLGWQAL